MQMAVTNAAMMERRRPSLSERKPKRAPPGIAPTMATEIRLDFCQAVNPHWRCRKVGYISCVPCDDICMPIMKARKNTSRGQFDSVLLASVDHECDGCTVLRQICDSSTQNQRYRAVSSAGTHAT